MCAAQYGYRSVVEMLVKAGATLDIQSHVSCLLNYTIPCSALEIHGQLCVTVTCLSHSMHTTSRLCSICVKSEDIVSGFLLVIRTLHDLAMMCMCTPSLRISSLARLLCSCILLILRPCAEGWMDRSNSGCLSWSSVSGGATFKCRGESRYTEYGWLSAKLH